MTEHKVNAVNLKSTDYNENDKILTLFSYENGLISARAKGVKKAGAKLKYAAQPFCFGQYLLCSGKSGEILCGCEYNELYYGIREDIAKYYAASAFAEYCTLFVQHQPETELFKLLLNCLNALCYGDAAAENILLHFLLNALKCSGYNMDFEKCSECGSKIEKIVTVSLSQGGFLCPSCSNGSAGGMAAYNTMKFTANTPLNRLSTVKTPKQSITLAVRYINSFISEITGSSIKSLKEFELISK